MQRTDTAEDTIKQTHGDANGREFLTFSLGEEEYGIDIHKVQEIRGYETVTRIANSPDFIKGVINLRGVIVPILDMRIRFNLSSAEYNDTTVVIMLNLADRVIGMVVDSVSDVIMLKSEQIKPPPEFGSVIDTRYVTGMGTIDDRMLILVDIERLLLSSDLALLDQAAAAS
ncbi:MAG: chemotaxis protein CheW [Halothiobacillaceae bacterium]